MTNDTAKTLSHEDVLAFYNDAESNTILINVLPVEYYDMAHIPHSINIPISLENFIDEVKEKTEGFHNVIVYCANDACTASIDAMNMLIEAGMDNVYDFEGGMQEWHEAGAPLSMNMGGGCGGGCGCGDSCSGGCGCG
jgi:rhodanese-related sulfurtransferase